MEMVGALDLHLEQIERVLASIKGDMAEFNKTKDLLNRFLEGEQRYKSLYEGSPDMYRTTNTEGIIIDCNNAYAKNLGYKKSEVVGGSIFDHVADNYLNEMRESFEIWLETGIVKNREVWFKRKDDTTFPALLSATAIYDDSGVIVGSNTIIRDITEIHRAKKRVEENVKEIVKLNKDLNESLAANSTLLKFKEMFEQLPDLLRAVDRRGIIQECNNAYAKALGYTKDQVIGASIFDHTAERSRDVLQKTFDDWISTGVDANREIWCKRKDGSQFPTLISVTTLTDPEGKIVGRLVSLRPMQ